MYFPSCWMSSSSSWVVVVLLVSLLARSMARLDCNNASVLSFKPYHPSCCVPEMVATDTVMTTFKVRQVGSDEWKLDVNITWDRPRGRYFNAYAVYPLDYTQTAYRANACDDEYSFFFITEMEWYAFENVPFGYNPYFIIYTANQTARLINRERNDVRKIELADCYESTQSISFCQTQEVEITGRPIGLQVDSIIADSQVEGAPPTATVTVSWNPPVQINSNVMLTSFDVGLFVNSVNLRKGAVDVLVDQRNYTDPFSLSFNHSFQGVVVNESNSVTIQVEPRTSCIGSLCAGNPAVLRTIIGPDDIVTLPPANMPTTSVTPNTESFVVVYAITGVAVLFVCVFLVALYLWCHYRNKRRPTLDNGIRFKRDHVESNGEAFPKNKPDKDFAQIECDRNILTEVNKISEIGKGSFGIVYKGFAYGTVNGKPDYYPVAIKCLKDNSTVDMKSIFLEEIRLMVDIGRHPNILPVLGCCTMDEPYLLITEFMKYGDLLHFLWKSRESKMAMEDPVYDLTETGQLQIARQVACGMEYLSQTRYYHGDLAARNILVRENLVVKISDFGLSNDTYEMGYKRLEEGRKHAVKWVSLETNTTRSCFVQSDVWSFGIVLYEIFTRGDAPYQGLSNVEVIEKLKAGYRMERPRDCPADVYAIMRKCWLEKPSSRPTFTVLYKSFDEMLARSADYLSFEESASSMGGSQDVLVGRHGAEERCNSDRPEQGSATSAELSGKSDELQLWLHLSGPLPEGARKVDFVPSSHLGEESAQSITPTEVDIEVEKITYQRDRDCDVLTA